MYDKYGRRLRRTTGLSNSEIRKMVLSSFSLSPLQGRFLEEVYPDAPDLDREEAYSNMGDFGRFARGLFTDGVEETNVR